jgi:SOS-response transcriptional repressor LexA
LVQELVDYRLAAYELRQQPRDNRAQILQFPQLIANKTELPFFPNLKIACGHFRTGFTDAEEYISLGPQFGQLRSEQHFIARASGNSMDGGKSPIRNGDYLLLERVSPTEAFPETDTVMAVERENEAGDESQYLLRVLHRNIDGAYILQANNPAYDDLAVTPEMRMVARLKIVIDPLQLAIGRSFMREAIPPFFGETFNPGNWNSGHVVLDEGKTHILLVTLNKQGKAESKTTRFIGKVKIVPRLRINADANSLKNKNWEPRFIYSLEKRNSMLARQRHSRITAKYGIAAILAPIQ